MRKAEGGDILGPGVADLAHRQFGPAAIVKQRGAVADRVLPGTDAMPGTGICRFHRSGRQIQSVPMGRRSAAEPIAGRASRYVGLMQHAVHLAPQITGAGAQVRRPSENCGVADRQRGTSAPAPAEDQPVDHPVNPPRHLLSCTLAPRGA
jgi:hypothetical protein